VSQRIHFGHCVGCDQPIRPPYLSFTLRHVTGDGTHLKEWEDVDVCDRCATKLTVIALNRVTTEEESA
jgi:hypothetical protein